MEYNFKEIESKWKQYWVANHTYKIENNSEKPKYYILDMFPYPSGSGLHVGHPLGYIASDIFARYQRLNGHNVLHPMGFDAFGLPAEQYALDTGQHPVVTTEKNITRYKEQLNNIGFSFDWDREVRTSDPQYYKWTQWIFAKLFHSWYNKTTQKAMPIEDLISIFETEGNVNHPSADKNQITFSADTWKSMVIAEQRNILMHYRLAFLDYAEVWWCEKLATVLANDEVVNGVSERGGHPVEKKKMRQWFLRITDYADRLLDSLNTLEWSDSMKEMQRNWIGKSEGAQLTFDIADHAEKVAVFTTRPDTIFGVDFLVLAPEHELIKSITTADKKETVDTYIAYVKSRSERERMSEKKISGAFTGAYAIHPFSGRQIPIWISEYVLAGYGTGAIMAVPAGDDRDFAFAKHFDISISNIFGNNFTGEAAFSEKTGTIENSDFISGLPLKEAASKVIDAVVAKGIGQRTINYRLRDAGFSRQRYWGEPFPIVYKNDIPFTIDEKELNLNLADQSLPVLLPYVDSYKPGPNGEGPLANIEDFVNITNQDGEILRRETNTMPGYAGSSWYFLRYMDPNNDTDFASKEATQYWKQIDLYIGGTEHAVGHLLYSRFWTKVLHDLGFINFDEPFKRLLNQGMIQGSSRFVFRINNLGRSYVPDNYIGVEIPPIFISEEYYKLYLKEGISAILSVINNKIYELNNKISNLNIIELHKDSDYVLFSPIHVDVSIVDGVILDTEAFKNWRAEYNNAEFILEEGKYICGAEVEKMSKSKYNVVNPDEIVNQYGADTFRMYEMFLGPIEMSKPWDTQGIEGVHRFLKKLWRLFYNESGLQLDTTAPTDAELAVLHKSIKKIKEATERFSFNTAVSQFMILTNELQDLKCRKVAVLESLVILLAPYAPHISEELWAALGLKGSVLDAQYPTYDEQYTIDNSKVYPVAVNGKARANLEFALDASQEEVEKAVLDNEIIQKWLDGKAPKKILYIKGKMINVVI